MDHPLTTKTQVYACMRQTRLGRGGGAGALTTVAERLAWEAVQG